jgi:hypothetical protein
LNLQVKIKFIAVTYLQGLCRIHESKYLDLPRRECVAVEEGEVGRYKVGTVGHTDGQLGGKVVLRRRNQWQQVIARSGAANAVGSPIKNKL